MKPAHKTSWFWKELRDATATLRNRVLGLIRTGMLSIGVGVVYLIFITLLEML